VDEPSQDLFRSQFNDSVQNNPNSHIDLEARNLSSKEEELLKKARDLENEMRQIRQAKVEVVVRQFEQ
jgi:hypothetical protein